MIHGSGGQTTILLVGTGIVSVFQSTDTNQTGEVSNRYIHISIIVYV